MTAVPKLQDVCKAIRDSIRTTLAANNAPAVGQIYIGWPTGTEEVQKLGQPSAEGSITIYPIKGATNVTRYPGEATIITAPQNNLIATVSHNTVTFSGVSDKAYNIHGFFGGKLVDAYYGTTINQSLISIAAAYATTINNLSVGLTANASGATVTLTNGQFQVVNIGSSGQFAIEELRIRRTIQVSVWINHWETRWILADLIMSSLGTVSNHFLTLSDGSQAYINYLADMLDDSSQSSYSLYVHHILFDVEYGQVYVGTGYEIEGLETVTTINENAPQTVQFG